MENYKKSYSDTIKILKNTFDFQGKKYFIETYGCQMNVRDSEIIAGILEEIGYKPCSDKKDADIILFNTCCVRDHAEKRLLGNIGALCDLKQIKEDMIIGVCGCMTQQESVRNRIFSRFPFVDIVIGTKMLEYLPEYILNALNGKRSKKFSEADKIPYEGLPSVRTGHHSTFVNITYGCNNFCTYCIVPYVRGRESSRSYLDIYEETKHVAEAGYDEVTFLGQNVNSYMDSEHQVNFPKLLHEIHGIEALKRIRFMTSHPKDLSDELIDAIAELPKCCHHVHLPLQSGSDRILKLMNRKYDTVKYLDIVQKLRSRIPDIEFTTDIIVGFPGETEEDFSDTLSFVKKIGYSSAFTFKYSPRIGTIAAGMENQIPESVKKERLFRLNELQNEITLQNNNKYIGYCNEVHVEGIEKNGKTVFGKYGNFKMVYFDGDQSDIGKYITVETDSIEKNSLRGHRIGL